MSKGVVYMLMATFTFAVMNIAVKKVAHIPAVEIILFRSVISLMMSTATLRWQGVSYWGNNRPVLLARGIVGALSLFFFFTLLQQIPMATASTLNYLAPIFTTILGVFFLKEKVKNVQWLFFLLSFMGILLVQGFDTRISTGHLLLGLASSFFMGIAYNLVRKLNHTEHPLVIMFYFPLVTLPIASVASWMFWVQPIGMDWLYLGIIGVLTQLAQYCMTKAYQAEEVNKVSILNYMGLLYSLVFGFVIFDETFNVLTYLGMALVVAGVLLNVLWKKTSTSPSIPYK